MQLKTINVTAVKVFQPHLCHMNHRVQHTTMCVGGIKVASPSLLASSPRTSLNMATLAQILVVVLAAVALVDGFVVRKLEKVHREKRSGKAGRSRVLSTTSASATQQAYTDTSISGQEVTTEYPSYDTTYDYSTTSSPWNYDTSTGGYPWQDSTTSSPYQTTEYSNNYDTAYSPYQTTDYSNNYDTTSSFYQTTDYSNNYDTTYSPYQTTDYSNNFYTTYSPYQTTNYDYWNNYYTTYSPWRYETSYDYWNYYTTYNPWRYETPYYDWNNYYTTYNPWSYDNTYPWNRWNRYDYLTTQSPNRHNQDVLLEALADDVVAEAREVVSGAEETLQKANDLEDAVSRANGEEGPRAYPF